MESAWNSVAVRRQSTYQVEVDRQRQAQDSGLRHDAVRARTHGQGNIRALIGQKYFGLGYDTVSVMFDHLTTGRQVEDFIDSRFDVVCPNSRDDMLRKWKAEDFRKALSSECDL